MSEEPLCPLCGNPIDQCTCKCPYCGEIALCECCIGTRATTGG